MAAEINGEWKPVKTKSIYKNTFGDHELKDFVIESDTTKLRIELRFNSLDNIDNSFNDIANEGAAFIIWNMKCHYADNVKETVIGSSGIQSEEFVIGGWKFSLDVNNNLRLTHEDQPGYNYATWFTPGTVP